MSKVLIHRYIHLLKREAFQGFWSAYFWEDLFRFSSTNRSCAKVPADVLNTCYLSLWSYGNVVEKHLLKARQALWTVLSSVTWTLPADMAHVFISMPASRVLLFYMQATFCLNWLQICSQVVIVELLLSFKTVRINFTITDRNMHLIIFKP